MIGLLREEEAAVRKDGKSERLREAAGPGQLWLQLPGLVREALYETVIITKGRRFIFEQAAYQKTSDTKNKGDYDGAIAQYRQAIKIAFWDTAAHDNWGYALYSKGDYDGAIAKIPGGAQGRPQKTPPPTIIGATP